MYVRNRTQVLSEEIKERVENSQGGLVEGLFLAGGRNPNVRGE
jgi:hypothetical protein